ncbi:MAG: HD domain-containing phosphohydrolase [Phycisphaeraceae bacterium JB051]
MNTAIPSENILFVDDEPNVLSGIRRQLHKQFHVTTAQGGAEALGVIKQGKMSFAIIVADMRMPEMNGVELLKQIATVSPNSVRMMLTGNADQQTAIDAINQGNIFRFLNKPCSPELLTQALNAGLKQYRLVTAERELLEQTLRGSIRILTEILSMVDPEGFGRSERIRVKLKEILPKLEVTKAWEIDLAAMLAPLGTVTIPRDLIIKQANDESLLANERQVLDSVPEVAHRLIQNIPRMKEVSQIILYQNKNYDGSGFPANEVKGADIPLGARLLRVLSDLIQLEDWGHPATEVVSYMRKKAHLYDPHLLDLALGTISTEKATIKQTINVCQVHAGMILAEDVCLRNGALLIRSGQVISNTLKERLLNYFFTNRIKEEIEVLAPEPDEQAGTESDNGTPTQNAYGDTGQILCSDDSPVPNLAPSSLANKSTDKKFRSVGYQL